MLFDNIVLKDEKGKIFLLDKDMLITNKIVLGNEFKVTKITYNYKTKKHDITLVRTKW